MLKLFLKSILVLPILIFMVYVSYNVDPSGLFFGSGFERIASEYMLEGHYINKYEQLDGRALNEVYAKNVPYSPQILVNGSSRSMMITYEISETRSFYNTANVSADFYDFFTSYYIFYKEDKLPETMILSIDPWLFNDSEEAIDNRSNKELYFEFLGEVLNIENEEYEVENKNERYLALLDPSYFQSSIDYYQKGPDLDTPPEIVLDEDVLNSDVVIKAPDGSIVYDLAFRLKDQGTIDLDALNLAFNPVQSYIFDELSAEKIEIFEKFIDHLNENNIEVVFYIPPFHPIVYDTALDNKDTSYKGFFATEEYILEFANEFNIPVYGSFDPYKLNLTNSDFYDGLHIKAESVFKIIPQTF